MARGVQLAQLVSDLKSEIGVSLNASVGTQQLDHLKYLLRRTQKRLYSAYSWPFMRIVREEALMAGERYYTFESELPFESVEHAWTQWGGLWIPVDQGITPELYGTYDSDAGQRADPVARWDIYENTQYEVWPVPASNGKFRMRGKKKLSVLTDDAHTADLDDTLIVLFAAAQYLKRVKSDDAEDKLNEAQAHLRAHRIEVGSIKRTPFLMAGSTGYDRPALRPGIDFIPG